MKKNCLGIVFLAISIVQTFQLSAGKNHVSLRLPAERLNIKNEKSIYCDRFYQFNYKKPNCYYDHNQNYVTIYYDGTYSVYYCFGVLATYYLDGSVRCDYNNGNFSIYDSVSGLNQYFSSAGYPVFAEPGLPTGVSFSYQIAFEFSNLDQEKDEEKDSKETEHLSADDGSSFVNVLKKSDEQRSLDENTVEEKENVKPVETVWVRLVKELSDSDFVEPKPITLKKELFNYVGLDNDAKLFLGGIKVENYTEIKSYIRNLVRSIDFSALLDAANDFRHSNNIQNRLLAKNILELILLNKNIKKYPLFQSKIYQYLGKIESHNNEHQEAINIFEKGLKYCENDARLYYFIGNNYAILERYDEAIENWQKAFRYVYVNDLEIKIKALERLLYCEQYHQKNVKTIEKLYFDLIDFIESNNVINDFKDIYVNLIIDFSEYRKGRNGAAIFTYKNGRSNRFISQNMLDMAAIMHEKHKEGGVL